MFSEDVHRPVAYPRHTPEKRGTHTKKRRAHTDKNIAHTQKRGTPENDCRPEQYSILDSKSSCGYAEYACISVSRSGNSATSLFRAKMLEVYNAGSIGCSVSWAMQHMCIKRRLKATQVVRATQDKKHATLPLAVTNHSSYQLSLCLPC